MTFVTQEDDPKTFGMPDAAIRHIADAAVTLRLLALDLIAETKRDDVRADLRAAHEALLSVVQACDLADARIAAERARQAEIEARVRLEMLLEVAGDTPFVTIAAD